MRSLVRCVVVLGIASAAACNLPYPENISPPIDAPVTPPPDAPPKVAMLSINEATHDFHDVQTETESFPAQFVVTNNGELPAGAIAVSVGGTNMDSFIVVPTGDASDCAGQMVGAGKTCVVQVKYKAGAPGPESAVLHVDADPGGMPFVALSGNSQVPGSLEVTAGAALDFSSVAIQSMSASKTITVHNKGGVPVTGVMVTLNDTTQYTKTSSTCGANLGANASCDISVRFNPVAVGAHASSVSVTSDQGGVAPQLTGVGTADIVVAKTGTGTIADTLSSPVISCGATCTGTYGQTPITLHATKSGSIPFNSWGGACAASGSNADCTLALTSPTTSVTATFGVCAPGAGMCTGGNLQMCDSTGHWGTPTVCALGCFTDGTRCYDVDPVNGLAAALDNAPNGPSLVLTDGATINTDDGTIVNGDATPVSVPSILVTQTSGPKIRAFEVKSAQLGNTKIAGLNALAVVSDGDVTIQGEIAAYGTGTNVDGTAPGGLLCTTSTGQGGSSFSPMGQTQYLAGGGGGSYSSVSAARGGKNGTVAGGAAGVANVGAYLRGGCGGGFVTSYSGTFPSVEAWGGPAGGAIQIVSRTSIIVKTNGASHGAINVGGGGGDIKGGGGGAGGAIMLEAPQVVVSGAGAALAANGGGGGGGCAAGTHGLPSASAAPGGAG